jgi:hypothetical protein
MEVDVIEIQALHTETCAPSMNTTGKLLTVIGTFSRNFFALLEPYL